MSNIDNKVDTPIVSLEEKLAKAERLLAKATDTIDALEKKLAAATAGVAPIIVQAPSDSVHLVYLSDSLGSINANGVSLKCSCYGESFALSRSQIDAIVGKYRGWFDEGILALGDSDLDTKVALEKDLKTIKSYSLTADKLHRLGEMTAAQIEKLWKECNSQEHKLSIVTFYKRNLYEGKPGYAVREKVECLNRLTNNGFMAEVKEVSGLGYKIEATDFLKDVK